MQRFRISLFGFLLLASVFFIKPVFADSLNDTRIFFVETQYSSSHQATFDTTLRYISDKAYFYVDNAYWTALSAPAQQSLTGNIIKLATEFDTKIYPQNIGFFGSEPNPGIDGDSRITIVLGPLAQGVGGLFDSGNQNKASADPRSNQREMVYINVRMLEEANDTSLQKLYGFLTHEFQHLITFNQKDIAHNTPEDIWLNELRSEYSVGLLGYNNPYEGSNLQRRINDFLITPSNSITEWKNKTADYGSINVFGQYIAEKYSPKIISDTLRVSIPGIQSIDAALARNGYFESFADVFNQWVIALKLNKTSINRKFGYEHPELAKINVRANQTIPFVQDLGVNYILTSLKNWQPAWFDIASFQSGTNNTLKITLDFSDINKLKFFAITSFGDGSTKVQSFNTVQGNTFFIPNIDTITNLTLIPLYESKTTNFSPTEESFPLRIKLERIANLPEQAILGKDFNPVSNPQTIFESVVPTQVTIQNGDLVRVIGDPKVYLIQGAYRRHIRSAKIFPIYGWSFGQVKAINSEQLSQYKESRLIRSPASQRVYEVDAKGIRRWLKITAQQFLSSGRSPESVFDVNLKELSFYKLGNPITR